MVPLKYITFKFFSVVIFILTLRSLKETFSDILVKMSVPISFLNLGYYSWQSILDLKYVNKILVMS